MSSVLSKSFPTRTAHVLVKGQIQASNFHTLDKQELEELIEDRIEWTQTDFIDKDYCMLITNVESKIESSDLHSRIHESMGDIMTAIPGKGKNYKIIIYSLKVPPNIIHFLLTQNYYQILYFIV